MNVQMFVYQYKNFINKAIAKHFGVDKIKVPKIKSFTSYNFLDKGFLVVAYYDHSKNIIGVNEDMWDIATTYERFNAVTHELIHAYQREYCLCEFDAKDVDYHSRSQELHCEKHTVEVLTEMGIVESYSILSLL